MNKINLLKETNISIIMSFFAIKYLYFIFFTMIFIFYNKKILFPYYLINNYILLIIVPIFYFYKIDKKLFFKDKLNFIIKNNLIFSLIFLITDYIYSLLIIITTKISDISNYFTINDFCATKFVYNIDFFLDIFFLFLFYNFFIIFSIFSIFKFSNLIFYVKKIE